LQDGNQGRVLEHIGMIAGMEGVAVTKQNSVSLIGLIALLFAVIPRRNGVCILP
jgi:hypothetical protein